MDHRGPDWEDGAGDGIRNHAFGFVTLRESAIKSPYLLVKMHVRTPASEDEKEHRFAEKRKNSVINCHQFLRV
jgi:hypothetical protein